MPRAAKWRVFSAPGGLREMIGEPCPVAGNALRMTIKFRPNDLVSPRTCASLRHFPQSQREVNSEQSAADAVAVHAKRLVADSSMASP